MDIQALLKKHGKSSTSERLACFTEIEKRHIFSANDLIEHFPDISRASIFRTIAVFLEIGILRPLPLGQKGELYERTQSHDHDHHHHEHMRCQKCSSILSFEAPSICHQIEKEARKLGFLIQTHSLSIVGTCKNCSSL